MTDEEGNCRKTTIQWRGCYEKANKAILAQLSKYDAILYIVPFHILGVCGDNILIAVSGILNAES